MIYNPYMTQQYPQYQPPQVQTRMVNDFGEITANDVPMSAPYTVFVKNDLSEIQLRHWNAGGQIEIIGFNASKVTKPKTADNEDIRIELSRLSHKVDDICKVLKVRRDRDESTGNSQHDAKE